MRKLESSRGETLIETLTALLVATVVLLFLSAAVAAATRVNKRVREIDTAFRYPENAAAQSETVTITQNDTGTEIGSIEVNRYTDDSGQYEYYRRVGEP